MSYLATLAMWSIAAAAVLSAVLAFMMAIIVEILLGLVKDAGAPALLVLVSANAIGWFLRRMRWPRAAGKASART
jgi:hypothetical protein